MKLLILYSSLILLIFSTSLACSSPTAQLENHLSTELKEPQVDKDLPPLVPYKSAAINLLVPQS